MQTARTFSLPLFAALGFATLAPVAHAFQLSPVVAALEPTGPKAEQVYLLTNSSQKPAAIQFDVTTRQQQSDGSESRQAANNHFSVQPSQVVIPAGGTQKVRVKWQGGAVSREQAYRFIAKQMPVKLEQGGDISINVVMTMEGALYVKPGNGAAAPAASKGEDYTPTASELAAVEAAANQTSTTPAMLQVQSVKTINTPQGKRLAVTLHNPAHEHIILNNARLQLSGAGKTLSLSGQQLGNLPGQNLLGGATRHFQMPVPAGFDAGAQWQGQLVAGG